MDLKRAVIQKADDIKKISADLAAAEAVVISSNGKTTAIRKVGGHKRPRDAEDYSSTGVQNSIAVSSNNKIKHKHIRLGNNNEVEVDGNEAPAQSTATLLSGVGTSATETIVFR